MTFFGDQPRQNARLYPCVMKKGIYIQGNVIFPCGYIPTTTVFKQ